MSKHFFVLVFSLCLTGCLGDKKSIMSEDDKSVQSAAQPNSAQMHNTQVVKQTADTPNNSTILKPVVLRLSTIGIQDIQINQPYNPKLLIEIEGTRNEEVEGCFFAKHRLLPESIEFNIMDDGVRAIFLRDDRVVSQEGIKVGDSQESVLKTYQTLTKVISPYTNQPVYIHWYQTSPEKIGIRYDIEDKKVSSIILGNEEALGLMEWCA